MVPISIEQLRQPAVPHSWQPVRRDGASSVIPHSHVAFIAFPSRVASVCRVPGGRAACSHFPTAADAKQRYCFYSLDKIYLSVRETPRAQSWRSLRSRRSLRSAPSAARSEEHTSELQSHSDLVC